MDSCAGIHMDMRMRLSMGMCLNTHVYGHVHGHAHGHVYSRVCRNGHKLCLLELKKRSMQLSMHTPMSRSIGMHRRMPVRMPMHMSLCTHVHTDVQF